MYVYVSMYVRLARAMDRPRRANAGRNMGKLIEQEEGSDEFYQTAYGGFEEASGDEEYEVTIISN